MAICKLSQYENEEWIPVKGSATFQIQRTTGPTRLAISSPASPIALLEEFSSTLPSPLFLLWVLHTPRTEAPRGRYQSEPLENEDVIVFLRSFGAFFEQDARSDIWVHSHEPATLVYERHGLIYAYGPLERFQRVLKDHGFEAGNVLIPSPHAHNYHAELDGAEEAVASALHWTATPLHPEDEQ